VDFRLLRIGTDGSATSIKLGEYPTLLDTSCSGPTAGITNAYVITNADQGVLVSWQVQTGATGAGGNTVNSTSNYVAVTYGTSVVSPSHEQQHSGTCAAKPRTVRSTARTSLDKRSTTSTSPGTCCGGCRTTRLKSQQPQTDPSRRQNSSRQDRR
jgi:hypothetical protein